MDLVEVLLLGLVMELMDELQRGHVSLVILLVLLVVFHGDELLLIMHRLQHITILVCNIQEILAMEEVIYHLIINKHELVQMEL